MTKRNLAFTMADRLARTSRECRTKCKLVFCELSKTSRSNNGLVGLRSAFTMAEILLSLTIIGVVAAITLPSLTGNINERTWNTQRKALYARFSQAIALMPALNGFGTLTEAVGTEGEEGYVAPVDTAAETFVTAGLSKVFKINNICSDNYADCGFVNSFVNGNNTNSATPINIGSLNAENIATTGYTNPANPEEGGNITFRQINAKAVAFETANGESILAFYNPNCQSKDSAVFYSNTREAFWIANKVCANFLYDLNGTKGPNTFGKDIGIISAFYPTDSVVVAPYPYMRNADLELAWAEANSACKGIDEDYRAPNHEEMMALMYNANIVYLGGEKYWASTRKDNGAWVISNTDVTYVEPDIALSVDGNSTRLTVRCVKR